MFTIANPWILLLLPLPWLLWLIFPRSKDKPYNAAIRIPFFNDIQQLTKRAPKGFGAQRWRVWWLSLIWLLVLIAASGPQWLGKPLELPRHGRNIMMAIDLSDSMRTPDMELNGQRVDRLTMVKHIADKFIQQRYGDRVGLILFGSKAYLQAPLTFDRKTVIQMLDNAVIGLAGPQTAIGDALGLAIKQLIKQPKNSRILVLLTDGVNTAGYVWPLAAAKVAAANNVKIYAIRIGSNQPMYYKILGGRQLLNPGVEKGIETLQKIAKMTGGLFFRARDGLSLSKAYQAIDKLEKVSGKKTTIRPITPLYPWFLGAALLLSMLLFLRNVVINLKRYEHN